MNLYGRLMVSLSEDRDFALQDFAGEINRVIRPPSEVSAEDIYVRAIYLVSDRVNSYGGRFPQDELENLCRLIIDSPVLVGHNKTGLPIARNFKAEVINGESESWVKVWFYWLKKSEGSRALLANIDGGIYKEGSIGFIFSLPECSICGEDIRNCVHVPLKEYGPAGNQKLCHYNYRKIEKVLETSLVFRGANPDTRATNELVFENEMWGKKDDSKKANAPGSEKKEGYYLRKASSSALLLIENNGLRLPIVFPQFNQISLEKNKSLIGYFVSRAEKAKDVLSDNLSSAECEIGNAQVQECSNHQCIISLEGKSLKGRFSLRPAFWNKRKLLLFSKLN
jgi:hypothetical protein